MTLQSLAASRPAVANQAIGPHEIDACPSCRVALLRLHELEAATGGLRREVELGARRLRTVMGQLALAEERAGHSTLASAIRSVAAGHSNLTFDSMCALVGQSGWTGAGPAAPTPRLGAREREVLQLITEGHRTPVIAARLGIAVATVEVHRRNIMRKLDLHTVAALTKYALREGLTFL